MVKVPTHAGTWIVEPDNIQRNPLMVARAVTTLESGNIPVCLLNPGTSEEVRLRKGMTVVSMEKLPEQESHEVVASIQTSAGKEENKHILWEIVQSSGVHLDASQQQQLYALLEEYQDIFALSSRNLGRTSKLRHKIDTGQASPIRQRVRRPQACQREEARRLLQDMLSQQVIQESASPWASPIVLVKKKDGSTRFCVDYRKVNTVTKKDAYPLPRINDTLDTLAGSRWFSTLDLLSGYWQVEVEECDREKTAFCTPEGLFEFRVMPFGLCNAPVTFQRLMDLMLAGLQWSSCLVYLDDVIILGRTFQEHVSNLQLVFQRLRDAGLSLKPAKCSLCKKEVNFLGHIVSEAGLPQIHQRP